MPIRPLSLALVLACAAGGALAQGCEEIRFARGSVSGEVSGSVADGAPRCFRFATGNGQTAQLQLSGSRNTCFTIDGVVDCRDDYGFRTRAQTYDVRVFQLMRSTASEAFTLRLTIR